MSHRRRALQWALGAGVGFTMAAAMRVSRAGNQNMNIDHIDARLEGKRCEVYFFDSWGTYSHPVKPIRPLFFEQNVLRDNYCRAWMCIEGNTRQFVLFEAMENERQPIEAAGSPDSVSVYLPRKGANPPAIERQLPLGDLIDLEEYIATTPADNGKAILIRQSVQYSFRYRYKPDGSLSSVTITNIDGKVNVLNY